MKKFLLGFVAGITIKHLHDMGRSLRLDEEINARLDAVAAEAGLDDDGVVLMNARTGEMAAVPRHRMPVWADPEGEPRPGSMD